MLYCADGGLEFGHSKSYLGHRVSEMLYLRPRANRRRMMTASIPLCPAYPPSSKASHLTSWAAAAAGASRDRLQIVAWSPELRLDFLVLRTDH
jgi:hypothetical protein